MKLNEAYEHRSDLCDITSYKAIELTSGTNGYPRNIRPAIIGFESFEEALEAAENTDGYVAAFHQKYGWQLWEEKGTMDEPFDLMKNYAEQHGTIYTNADIDNFNDFMKREFVEPFGDADSLDAFSGAVVKFVDLYNAIDALEDDEFLYVEDNVFTTIKKTSMSDDYDSNRDVIGVTWSID